jgi:hypothetical protein
MADGASTLELTNRYPAGRTDTVSRQGICPAGWHLPSDYEWILLEKEIATNPGSYSSYADSYATKPGQYNYDPRSYDFLNPGTYQSVTLSYRPVDVAPATTNKAAWGNLMQLNTQPTTTVGTDIHANPNGQASSKSASAGGFAGLLVGYTSNYWYDYGKLAYFWSSSSFSNSSTTDDGWIRGLDSSQSGVNRIYKGKYYLNSVRCKKN